MNWRRGLAVVVLAALAATGGYIAYELTRPTVLTTRAVRGPVVQAFYSTGTVSPEREFPVRAQVSGIVTRLTVDKGSRVRRGQLLAVVEDPTLRYAVAKAEAELREKQALADPDTSPILAEIDAQREATAAVLEIARREYDRLERMRAADASTTVDLDRALDRVKTLASEVASLDARRRLRLIELRRQVEVAEAAVAAARAELAKQDVLSPTDGVVLDRPTPEGTRVDPTMNNHLMTIADVSPDALVMRAQVDEEDIASVVEGQVVKLTLYAYGDELFVGRVERIYDKADPERRTFEVDVRFDRRGRHLAPGMTGELAFIESERFDAWVLPTEAVQVRLRPRRPGEPRPPMMVDSAAAALASDEIRELVVWTVRDGRLEPRQVEVGLRGVERVEILSGVTAEDEVVVSAVDPRTRPGTRVRMRPAAPMRPEPFSQPPATPQLSGPDAKPPPRPDAAPSATPPTAPGGGPDPLTASPSLPPG